MQPTTQGVCVCVFVVSVWACCGGFARLLGRECRENQSIRKGMGLSVLCVLSPQPSTLQDTVEHVMGMITPNTRPCPHRIPPHSPAQCPFDPDLPHLLPAAPSSHILRCLVFSSLSSFSSPLATSVGSRSGLQPRAPTGRGANRASS